MSRATRKAYNMGKRDGERLGYLKGYSDGLIDGNPFNSIIKAANAIIENINNNMTPENIALIKEAIKNGEDPDDEETPTASEV